MWTGKSLEIPINTSLNTSPPSSIFIEMELLSNKSPLLGLITTFPLCADALKRMQKHTGIEESI
jgi:hypothetical protein